MIVSQNWLKDYVPLDMPLSELEYRLMMTGLNHEGTEKIDDDYAIDLEVTSNRPDCLGHLGVARDISVIWNVDLKLPAAKLPAGKTPVDDVAKIAVECPDLCTRYTARVIRGVKVGPSPDWLVSRLKTLGLPAINNVVDISNYVLMETGQPLHVFDLAKLSGSQIIVRNAKKGEQFEAINHKTYELSADMCVIADAEKAVALGGVMGGAYSEVGNETVDLLIESADFDSMSIRATSRALNLRSDSSYRFERRVDPEGVDWASRRCCELILELAGGELAEGMLDNGAQPQPAEPVTLRFAQVERVLGIAVEAEQSRKILTDLGCQEQSADQQQLSTVPPSWRGDLTREIDLIEEVARIYGYDKIPQDSALPMVASSRSDWDRVIQKVCHHLTSAGYSESMTISTVNEPWSDSFSPWSDKEPLRVRTAILRGADRLRRSLVPGILGSRKNNEALANSDVELFEIAKVYLAQDALLPEEQWHLSITTGGDYFTLKGLIESLVQSLSHSAKLEVLPFDGDLLDHSRSAKLMLNGEVLGFCGEVAAAGLKTFELRNRATVAELNLQQLQKIAELIPQHQPLSTFPTIDRDINLVVEEKVSWSDIANTASSAAGEWLESLKFQETYRNAADPQLGGEKKSVVFTFTLRKADGSLTSDQADQVRDKIVTACESEHAAQLRA